MAGGFAFTKVAMALPLKRMPVVPAASRINDLLSDPHFGQGVRSSGRLDGISSITVSHDEQRTILAMG
jgi:hypothetical protein